MSNTNQMPNTALVATSECTPKAFINAVSIILFCKMYMRYVDMPRRQLTERISIDELYKC